VLTAWATAGIFGPVVVNYIREFQLAAGVSRAQVYDFTMYILAGMLALGLIANALIRPLADKWFMSEAEVAAFQDAPASARNGTTGSFGIGRGGLDDKAVLAWTAVAIPIFWGLRVTLKSVIALF